MLYIKGGLQGREGVQAYGSEDEQKIRDVMKFNNSIVMFEYAGYPLVGNPNTGYVIGLTKDGAEVCEALMHTDVSDARIIATDKDLFLHLSKGGYFDEQMSYSIQSSYLHVTQRCNLSCVGCYSEDEQRNAAPDPTLGQLGKASVTLAEMGVKTMFISGGEPFLRKDLPEIVRFAHDECGIEHISVITNGTIRDKELIVGLKPYVEKIAISVDGYSEKCPALIRREQRFGQLMETLKVIQAEGIPVHLIPTIHAKNIDDTAHYVALAKACGATMNFSLLSCPSSKEELVDLLPAEEDLHKLGRMALGGGAEQGVELRDTPLSPSLTTRRSCGAAKNGLSIGSDGTVYPCHMLHDRRFSLGNIFDDEKEQILNSEVRNMFSRLDVEEFSECSDCSIKHLCGGGCRARAFYASEDIKAKDSYCLMAKEFYDGLEGRLRAMIEQQNGGEK